MNRSVKYPLVAALLVIIGMYAGYKLRQSGGIGKINRQVREDSDKFTEALRYVQEHYVEDPEHGKLVDDAIKGMLEGLDPHSFYIPAQENQAMEEQMEGSFEGIGIEFNLLEDTIYVVAPIDGGPSDEAGILSGDRILTIEGEMVAGKNITSADVMKKLKGKKGTTVHLGILRRGNDKTLNFEIRRDKIPIHSMDFSYMITDDVGYLRLSRFARTTHEEFLDALSKLKQSGMKRLILDLRDNPGGYMDQAEKIADEFLSAGKMVVYTEGRTTGSSQEYQSTSEFESFEKGALVVLINYGSASASEIVAGAVQDWDRALILGVRSFGKGLVQTQHDFSDGSAIRIVVSKYFTPSGRCIQKPYHMSSEEYDEEINHRFTSGEIYDSTKIDVPDSLRFRTKSGRIVFGGGGIIPDVFVPRDTSYDTQLAAELSAAGAFRQFAYDYTGIENLRRQWPDAVAFLKRFEPGAEMMAQFEAFARTKVSAFSPEQFRQSLPLSRNLIKAFLGKKLYGDEGFHPVLHQQDNVIQRALRMLPAAEELEKTGKFTNRP